MKTKKYEELNLRDDFMFGKVMRDRELCRKMLETILGVPVGELSYPEIQKAIDIKAEGKNVRLDVYVLDDQEIVYNAEMQQLNHQKRADVMVELPIRSRYYQGMIDINLLEKGLPYDQLNESCVIFICNFDPFGYGRCRYTFQNRCLEDEDLLLEDGTTKIFLNTKGRQTEDVSDELKAFLDYLERGVVTNVFTKELESAVRKGRYNEEWRREYMKAYVEAQRIRREGWEEGREEGVAIGVADMQLRTKLLSQWLRKQERVEELLAALEDSACFQVLWEEYENAEKMEIEVE